MPTPNFTQCASDFQNSIELYGNYVYTGPVQGILKHTDLPLITVQGCRDLCGTGNVYYKWTDIATTISTWILPILGLLLQCPFDSNDFRNTIYAIARWLGSPVASLAYTLWNIKITSKSAMMVDMVRVFLSFLGVTDTNTGHQVRRDTPGWFAILSGPRFVVYTQCHEPVYDQTEDAFARSGEAIADRPVQ